MPDPDVTDLVPLRLVPVEVFGAECVTHCPGEDPDCGSAFGLMDAVQAWSDCNRAYGHLYRVDDTEPRFRQPGDTVEIWVRRTDLPWFEKRFGEEGGEPAGKGLCGNATPHYPHHRCPGIDPDLAGVYAQLATGTDDARRRFDAVAAAHGYGGEAIAEWHRMAEGGRDDG